MTAVDEDRLARIMAQIEEFPEGSVERCEALAFTFLTLARAQWRKADHLRRLQDERDRRRPCPGSGVRPKGSAFGGRGTCLECGGSYRVRADGTVWRHPRPRS